MGSATALTRSFHWVITVQFLSAVADNALLIIAIARMDELAAPAWLVPLLKLCFTLCYVLLAPFVGALADHWPKGRVMVAANVLKTLAALVLLCAGNPLLAMVVAGLGAALYAPAKYGLLCEMLPPQLLVKANGYFEGSTVCAVILGTVLGGLLVSPGLRGLPLPEAWGGLVGLDTTLFAGMLALLALYLLATLLNLGVADSGVRYTRHTLAPRALVRRFLHENRLLWRDPLGGLSMAVTTLLWGIGATLQLLVLRWAGEALGLPLAQAAYLQGVTAVGVIAGAVLASHRVTLAGATRLLPLGIVMGLAVPALGWVQSLVLAGRAAGRGGGHGGLFRRPHERAAAAPWPQPADRRAIDRGAGLQRERRHPADDGGVRRRGGLAGLAAAPAVGVWPAGGDGDGADHAAPPSAAAGTAGAVLKLSPNHHQFVAQPP